MPSSSSASSSSAPPPPQYSSLPSPSFSNSTSRPFISRTTTVSNPVFPTRRPWEEVFALYSFTRPCSLAEARLRVKRNLTHFRVNYFNIVLSVIGIGLLWHPISIIVFLVTLVPWFFLYFYRDKPLVLFARTVDDRAVEVALSAVTVVAVGLTGVWVNVLVSIFVGVVLVGLHAAFRSTEDLYVDEHEGYGGGLLSSFVGGTPAKHTLHSPRT